MFVLALKRAVLVLMRRSVVTGRSPCPAARTECDEDSWPAARVVIVLSELTALGGSLPSVVVRAHTGGRCVSALGVGWR
jgi:hypothetical protein